MPARNDLTLDRRELLSGAGAVAVAGLGAAPARANADQERLGALAGQKGILYGASFAVHELDAPYADDYARIYKHDCRVLTSELELKMATLRPEPGVLDFGPADRLLAFADANGMKVRGHTLIWHDALPQWVHKLGPGEADYLLESHIETVMERYRGRIVHWDVVNEPIGPWDHLPGNLRTGVFRDAIGEDYIAKSFRIARSLDKDVKLVLNEGGTEASDEQGQVYRDSLLALLKRLRDKDTPIDAIGLECHLDSARPYDFPRFAAFVAELAEMGFEIHLTEVDVKDAAFPSNIAERDSKVAALYRGLLDAVLPIKAVTTVVNWQLADHTSWHWGAALSKGQRKPRPLPYDSGFRPKPAWHAMADAFRKAPPR